MTAHEKQTPQSPGPNWELAPPGWGPVEAKQLHSGPEMARGVDLGSESGSGSHFHLGGRHDKVPQVALGTSWHIPNCRGSFIPYGYRMPFRVK